MARRRHRLSLLPVLHLVRRAGDHRELSRRLALDQDPGVSRVVDPAAHADLLPAGRPRVHLPHAPARAGGARAAAGRGLRFLNDGVGMPSWHIGGLLLLGGSPVLLFAAVPVAFSFLAVNLIGAALFLGGAAGVEQIVRNSVVAVANFSLTPIPLFVLMGEVLFHTGLALSVIE